MCDLMPMKNNDKAYIWSCNDFSEEGAQLEKLCLRFQTLDNCNKFKEAFEAARKFNLLVKEGKSEELVMAPVVEDKEEVVVDDPDKNKTAGEEGNQEDGDQE